MCNMFETVLVYNIHYWNFFLYWDYDRINLTTKICTIKRMGHYGPILDTNKKIKWPNRLSRTHESSPVEVVEERNEVKEHLDPAFCLTFAQNVGVHDARWIVETCRSNRKQSNTYLYNRPFGY